VGAHGRALVEVTIPGLDGLGAEDLLVNVLAADGEAQEDVIPIRIVADPR
jgi:hypothetical protein